MVSVEWFALGATRGGEAPHSESIHHVAVYWMGRMLALGTFALSATQPKDGR